MDVEVSRRERTLFATVSLQQGEHSMLCSLTRSSWHRAQEHAPCLLTVGVGAAMLVFLAVVGLEGRRYKQGCLKENTPLKGGKSSNQENRDPKYPVVLHCAEALNLCFSVGYIS